MPAEQSETPETITTQDPPPVALPGGILGDTGDLLLDGLAGFCLLPAATSSNGGTPAFLGSIAVRHGLVEEWLTETVAKREAISEAALLSWLDKGAAEDETRRNLRGILEGGDAPAPACGSALLFAPVTVATYLWQPVRVFRSFYGFSALDQGAGRAVTGLLASLLSQAVVARPFRAGLGAWVATTSGRLLRDLRRVPFPGSPEGAEDELQELDLLEEALIDVADCFTGRSGEGESEADLLDAVMGLPSLRDRRDVPGSSSLAALALVMAALEIGGDKPRSVLSLLDGQGDVERSARSLAAGLLGAWYGRQGLEESFEADFERGEDRLWRDLRLEVATDGALLLEVAGLLELPDSLHLVAADVPMTGDDLGEPS